MDEHAGRGRIFPIPGEEAIWPAEMALTAAIRVALAAGLTPLAIGDAIRAGYEWNFGRVEVDRQTTELADVLRSE